MAVKKEKTAGDFRDVPLSLIDEPKGMVRLDISQDAIVELAENIRAVGLLTPILIRSVGKRFEIIAGHRRYLAFKHLERNDIMCRVDEMDDLSVAIARASENIFREDISPIEEGAVYLDLQDTHNMNYDEISKKMKKPPSRIKRRMDLMRMPVCLQKAVHAKLVSASVGEALWRFGDEAKIEYYLSFAIENGATKRVIDQWVRDWEKEKRGHGENVPEGDSLRNPNEPTKFYAPCDICQGALEIGTETPFRSCPDCARKIREALRT